MRRIGLSRSDAALRSRKTEGTINDYRNAINASNERLLQFKTLHQPRPPNLSRPKATIVSPTRRAKMPVSSLDDLKQVVSNEVLQKQKKEEDSKLCLKDSCMQLRITPGSSSDESGDYGNDDNGIDKDYDDDDDDDDNDDDEGVQLDTQTTTDNEFDNDNGISTNYDDLDEEMDDIYEGNFSL